MGVLGRKFKENEPGNVALYGLNGGNIFGFMRVPDAGRIFEKWTDQRGI